MLARAASSLCLGFGCMATLALAEANENVSNVLSFMLAIVLGGVFWHAIEAAQGHPRETLLSFAASLLIAIPIAFGQSFSFVGGELGQAFAASDYSLAVSWRIPAVAAAYALLITAVILALFGKRDLLRKMREALDCATPGWLRSDRSPLILFGAILILWIPAFLTFFPGYYASDGPIQVRDLFLLGTYDLHQPIAHTFVLTSLLSAGNALFGSYNSGLALYCVAQALLVAFSLSYAFHASRRWGCPSWAGFALALLVAVNPIVQAWTFTTTKDTMFGAFLLLTFVCATNLVIAWRAKRKAPLATVAACAVSLLLLCLLRKQGVYVAAIAVAAFLLANRKCWRQILLAFALPTVCAFAFNTAIGPLTDAVPDSAREMLSVPSQQIARVHQYERDSLSETQLDELARYFDLEGLEGYIPVVADPAKGALNEDALKEDPLGFVFLWIGIGLDHPGTYLDAFLAGTLGYCYSSPDVSNRWSGLSPWNEFDLAVSTDPSNQIEQRSLLPSYYEYLQSANDNFLESCPVLSLFVTPALPYLVFVIAALIIAWRRQPTKLLALIFPMAFWLSLLLGPVMCSRYTYPIVLCIPAVLALACSPSIDRTERKTP